MPWLSDRERGWTSIEFTLVGIPMMFILVSTFEVVRGMWTYHILAYSVKEGTRYASVHGYTCTQAPNTCAVTVAQVVQKVIDSGAGLISDQLNLTLVSNTGSISCRPASTCISPTLDNTVWPQAPGNTAGSPVEIHANYPFQSALSMIRPGAGSANFGLVNFTASSREAVQY